MTDFTPGPWCVFHMGGTIAIERGKTAKGTRPNIIDWVGFDSNEQSAATDLANARLIASAPDMLEALEKAVKLHEDLHPSATRSGSYLTKLCREWRDLISKARGQA